MKHLQPRGKFLHVFIYDLVFKMRGKEEFYYDTLQIFPLWEDYEKEYPLKKSIFISHGVLSTVVKCFKNSSKQYVAIKGYDIPLDYFNRKEELRCFERDLLFLKQLQHPLILKYIDSFRDEREYPYIVTELATAGSLDKIIGRLVYPRMPLIFSFEDILDAALHVAIGVKHLHKNNIVYRDLKIGNVFMFQINENFKIYKIGDFGVSKDTLKEVSQTAKHYLCSEFLAPEALEGNLKTFKNDSWALGILIYMMCCDGTHPFYDGFYFEKDQLEILKKGEPIKFPDQIFKK